MEGKIGRMSICEFIRMRSITAEGLALSRSYVAYQALKAGSRAPSGANICRLSAVPQLLAMRPTEASTCSSDATQDRKCAIAP